MNKAKLFVLFFLISTFSFAQFFTDSNLPIVIINTEIHPTTGSPQEIPDEPRVWGNMKIIYRPDGTRNFMSDQNNSQYLNYNGKINIEIRGSSSQVVEKKSYGLTTYAADKITKNNVEILGMPKENDWILHGLAFDESLMRNHLSYDLARSIGNYAARCEFCELVINGDYRGIYVFMEKIKVDGDRINIAKMTNLDNELPDLSGGYVIKADKSTGGDPIAWTMSSYYGFTNYIYDKPNPWEITSQQGDYIHNQFTSLENAAALHSSDIATGYPSVIDVPSFVDYIIISELASNADSYQYSTFFHKDRGGKLRAGPVWDYDLTYGNDLFFWGLDRSFTDVWQFDNSDNTGSKFWRDLYNTPTFKCYLAKRWNELSGENKALNYTVIENRIDQLAAQISEAIPRENTRWDKSINHESEIAGIKDWINIRMQWLNMQLDNYSDCSNPVLPELVISKINYHPIGQGEFEDEDLEFIEITNSGIGTIDLSGVYFSQLGISYQFPYGTKIEAGERIYLAGDKSAFQQVYGLTAFDRFDRNLSNKSEKIVLADAFGNVIDSVRYTDEQPWPVEADGNGFFLELTNVLSDNSVALNWQIASSITTGIREDLFAQELNVFPNPARFSITVDSKAERIVSCGIYDLSGRKLRMQNGIYSNRHFIEIEKFNAGMYVLKLELETGEKVNRRFTKME